MFILAPINRLLANEVLKSVKKSFSFIIIGLERFLSIPACIACISVPCSVSKLHSDASDSVSVIGHLHRVFAISWKNFDTLSS